MKRCVIIFLLSIEFICASSQTLQISSRKSLPSDVGDAIGEFYDQNLGANQRLNVDSVLALIDQSLSEYPDSLTWFRLQRAKASFLASSQRHDEIPSIVSPAIEFAERHQMNSALVELYDFLAIGQTYRGEYSDALRSYHRIIPLLYQDSIRKIRPEVFNNIGMLYYKIRDSRTAIRYFKDANAIAPNPKSFLSIALAYSYVDSVEQGWASIRKAEMLMRTFGTASADELMLQFVCGKLHFAQNPDSAQARFHKSLRLARSEGDRRMEAENLVNLARIHLNKQSWQEAEAFLLLAERISLDEELDEILLEVLRQSIIMYTSVSDKRRLVEYQRRFIQYKEKLFNSGLSFDLAKTEGEFLEKQQQKRIQVQKSTIHFQMATLKYQSLIGVVGFVILLLLFVLFYFNYNRLRRKIQIGHLLEIRVTERTNRLKESIIQSDFRRRVEEARLSKLETDASILITNAMIEIDGISGEVRGCTSMKYLKMTSFTLKNPPPEHNQ